MLGKWFVYCILRGFFIYLQGYPAIQGYMAPGYYQQYATAYSNPQAAAAGEIFANFHYISFNFNNNHNSLIENLNIFQFQAKTVRIFIRSLKIFQFACG